MKRLSVSLFAAALALGLAGGNAQATLVFVPASWHIDWTAVPSPITIDAATSTQITITDKQPAPSRIGTSNTVATNIFSTSKSAGTITFGPLLYQSTAVITDDQSGQTASVSFLNFLSGTVSQTSSVITTTFGAATFDFPVTPGPTPGSFILGKNTYSIVLDSFVAPDGPGALKAGSLGGLVTAVGHFDDRGGHQDMPEPSTMLLSCVGLSFLGAATWRRWRGQKPLAAA